MVVYFSSFIPFYANICAPLFKLLRKGARWEWGPNQEYTFKAAKLALQDTPLLGHPIEGLPYRLYSDTSDEAAGVALQQIQPVLVRDLKGTKAYERLKKADEEGLPPPNLTTRLGGTFAIHASFPPPLQICLRGFYSSFHFISILFGPLQWCVRALGHVALYQLQGGITGVEVSL
jgi:hypothetical protein